MSDLDDAIASLNESADRANNTTDFFDSVTTGGETATVTNPNNNKTVPSVQKQVKDLYDDDSESIYLMSVAMNVGTTYDDVMYSDDLITPIVSYIFDYDSKNTYVTASDAIGKTIQSFVDGLLTTTDLDEYQLDVYSQADMDLTGIGGYTEAVADGSLLTNTIDASVYNVANISTTDAVTITNIPVVTTNSYTLTMVVSASSLDLSSLTVLWQGGTAPTITSDIDLIFLSTFDQGVTWLGSASTGYA